MGFIGSVFVVIFAKAAGWKSRLLLRASFWLKLAIPDLSLIVGAFTGLFFVEVEFPSKSMEC